MSTHPTAKNSYPSKHDLRFRKPLAGGSDRDAKKISVPSAHFAAHRSFELHDNNNDSPK